jgi:hypothetical protein
MDLLTLLYTLAPVIAASDDSDAAALAPLVLCLAGFIFYGVMYSRYRNADKRHLHEAETKSETADVRGLDQLVKHQKGLSNANMKGANDSQIEGALNVDNGVIMKNVNKILKQ